MKLFKVWQEENSNYDTFDSMVVAASDEDEARNIMPSWDNKVGPFEPSGRYGLWAYSIDAVKVEYLGEAKDGTEKSIIIASFNAG